MSTEFRAERVQNVEDWESVSRLDCENPFLTSAYICASAHIGVPWMLSVFDDADQLETATVGYLSRGRLECALEIMSLPDLKGGEIFWNGVQRFCAEMGVNRLRVNSFGSPAVSIPSIGVDVTRRPRTEFVLGLPDNETPLKLSSNHKRNIKKAVQAGLVIRRKADRTASEMHAQLMGASMRRRKNRGEQVTLRSEAKTFERFLETGAGVIYQACEDDQVLSSILILLAERGAYYHSAGTSEEGMSKGASAYLINELATQLRADGFTSFNLGGVGEEQEGLARFKSGFGAQIVELEAAELFLGSQLRKGVTSAIRMIQRQTRPFLKKPVGDV